MLSLADAQSNFIDTINNGPDRLNPMLFAGPRNRILLGLKAHANTINHARIIALEETFPFTRQHLGHARFNKLAREFVETDAARANDANQIGIGFPDFLDDAAMIELAQIEWAWLQSYHAAEAVPLVLADLGGLDGAVLLALPVRPHPSARVVTITAPISSRLEKLAGMQPAAMLTLRPDAEVRLLPLDATKLAVFEAATQENATLGNLLAVVIEMTSKTTPLGPVMDLISAGALVKAG